MTQESENRCGAATAAAAQEHSYNGKTKLAETGNAVNDLNHPEKLRVQTVFRTHRDRGYTKLSNQLLQDTRLSRSARGAGR